MGSKATEPHLVQLVQQAVSKQQTDGTNAHQLLVLKIAGGGGLADSFLFDGIMDRCLTGCYGIFY